MIIDIGRRKIENIFEEIYFELKEEEEEGKKEETRTKKGEKRGSDYFVDFQNNNEKSFKEIKENSLKFVKILIKWVKGKERKEIYFEEIWNDIEERRKSNVDKISFTTLLIICQFLQKKLKDEGKSEIVNKILFNIFGENKDLSQHFLSIDENELESHIVEEILGNDFREDLKKKDYLIEILVKFDFLLLKGFI